MVGQNLGAGKPERAAAAVWRAALYNAVFYLGVGIVLLLFAHVIVSIFTTEPAVLDYGASGLHILAFGFVFAPRVTRFFAGILASVAASDFLQRAYLAAKERT